MVEGIEEKISKTFLIITGICIFSIVLTCGIIFANLSGGLFQPSVCSKLEVNKYTPEALSSKSPFGLMFDEELKGDFNNLLADAMMGKEIAILTILSRYDSPVTIKSYSINRGKEIKVQKKPLTFSKETRLYTKEPFDSLIETTITTDYGKCQFEWE